MSGKGGQPSETWTPQRRRKQSAAIRRARLRTAPELRSTLRRAAFSIDDEEYTAALALLSVESFLRRAGIFARMSKKAFTAFAKASGVDERVVPGVRAKLRSDFGLEDDHE